MKRNGWKKTKTPEFHSNPSILVADAPFSNVCSFACHNITVLLIVFKDMNKRHIDIIWTEICCK